MRLVANEPKYWEFIRELRNHPDVKKGFIEQDEITSEQQEKYMSVHNDRYYICLFKGIPVGYIGDMFMDIRLAVHPSAQGRGIGRFMLNRFKKIQPGAYAKVLLDNHASKRLFESCGFYMTHKNGKFYYFVRK